MTQLEEATSNGDVDPRRQIEQGVALLSSMPGDRRALLEQLLVNTRSAEMSAQIAIDTALAVYGGILGLRPEVSGPSSQEFKNVLETQRPQLIQMMGGMVLASFAQTYSSLETAMLRQYVEFLGTDAGRHFTHAMFDAWRAALADAALELGRQWAAGAGERKS